MGYEIDFRGDEGGPIKRLIWSTDLHLDASEPSQNNLYFDLIVAHEPDYVLVGGDICNGIPALTHLTTLSKHVGKQLYFVLGNHDFYYGSIQDMRSEAKRLSAETPAVHYLTDNGIIALSEQTGLIGHDGWSDAYAGDFLNSDVLLNDYFLIDELKKLNHEERFQKLHELGKEAASYLHAQLIQALKTYDRIVLLTHVPPFEEACLNEGLPADDMWKPHFVGKATGDALESVMKENPDKHLLVLCGHTHWGQDIQILPNLRVVTGHSELGMPNVQGLIYIN